MNLARKPVLGACLLLLCPGLAVPEPWDVQPRRTPRDDAPIVPEPRGTASPIERITAQHLLVTDRYDFRARKLAPWQAREDLAVLAYALKHAYVGSRGLPAKAFEGLEKGLERLSAKEGLSSSEVLCNEIAKVFLEAPDGHLKIEHPDVDCGSRFLRPKSPPGVGANQAAGTDKPWAVDFVDVNGTSVPVISIHRSDDPESPGWQGFLDAVKRAMDQPAVIVDLRGDGGGSSRMGQRAANLFYGFDAPPPIERVVTMKTASAHALEANYYGIGRLVRKRGEGPAKDEFADEFRKFASVARDGREDEVEVIDIARVDVSTYAYERPIIVLIDGACASACEVTAMCFEAHPHAVLVGEDTAGALQFGVVRPLALPHSQTIVTLGTVFWKLRDDRFIETTGIPPKVRVRAGEDALQAAKDILGRRLVDPREGPPEPTESSTSSTP